jgi:hypothetical protein
MSRMPKAPALSNDSVAGTLNMPGLSREDEAP